jgi:ABC-2 type transport system ATP-binding protein
MDAALDIRNLRKDYGRFRLKDVSFVLPRGFIMGLIGPNGAGKTTIIKLILNLIRRDGGEIRILGLDDSAGDAARKIRVGFVHDSPCFYEHLTPATIRRTVAPFYPDWDDALFLRLMDEFRLPLRKRFMTLSRGTKMKFALALALSHKADLLILDEPTTGLDPAFRRDFLARLSAFIQDEGKAVLFSTHITTDLERIADFITLIRDGEIMFSAPKDDILGAWAVVKGGPELLRDEYRGLFRGIRKRDFGVQALTDKASEARRRLGREAVIETAGLEDIMYYLTKGNGHA